jgi:uncharacterized protein YycO
LRLLRRVFYFVFIGFGVLVLSAAAVFYRPEREPFDGAFDFRNGDVVFIRGRTWRSFLVRFAEASNDFSHVGIVSIVDGVPYVVHATPDAEVVRLERAEDFLSPANADRAAVYRLDREALRAEAASREARNYFERGISFDHRFDIANGDRLYCTELVWRAFKAAGVELGEGKENFLYDSKVYGEVLLPQALSECLRHVRDM